MSYRQVIDVLINGTNRIDNLVNQFAAAERAAAGLSESIESINQRLADSPAATNRAMQGYERASRRWVAIMKARKRSSRAEDSPLITNEQRQASREAGAAATREASRDLSAARQRLRNAKIRERLLVAEVRRNKERQAAVDTARERLENSMEETMGSLTGAGLQSRRARTTTMAQRRTTRATRLDQRGLPSDVALKPFSKLWERSGQISDRVKGINDFLDRLDELRTRVERSGGKNTNRNLQRIENLRSNLTAELGSLAEGLAEIQRITRGRRSAFNTSRIVRDRANTLFETGEINEEKRRKIIKKADAAVDLSNKNNVDAANTVLQSTKNTLDAEARRIANAKLIKAYQDRQYKALIAGENTSLESQKERTREMFKYQDLIANTEKKIRSGKTLNSKELQAWMGGRTVKALPPAAGYPLGQPLPREAMLPTGGARLIGQSREFLTNAAGRRTYIPELDREAIARLLPSTRSAATGRRGANASGPDIMGTGAGFGVNNANIFKIFSGFAKSIGPAFTSAAKAAVAESIKRRGFANTVSKTETSLSGLVNRGRVADNVAQPVSDALADLRKEALSTTTPLQDLKDKLTQLQNTIAGLRDASTASVAGARSKAKRVDSLTSLLADFSTADVSSKVFRGGRSPEAAIGKIASSFNSATGQTVSGNSAQPGLRDLGKLSRATNTQLELLQKALSETRDGMRTTDKQFRELTKTLAKVEDQQARRDPNADFLTKRFGSRGSAAISEGLIGGAFPLLFGQGLGASTGGLIGGAAGGAAGGMLGFGLSLVGTAIGSAADALAQAAIDTGNSIRDVVANFSQLQQANIITSRTQEGVIQKMIESGRVATAYAMIQEDLGRTIGYENAQKLIEASNASDKFNRALAQLGKQMEVFIAGPLTTFLNKLTEVLNGQNQENTVQRLLQTLPADQRKQLQKDLVNAVPGDNVTGINAFGKTLPINPAFGFLFGANRKKAGELAGSADRSLIPPAVLQSIIQKFTPLQPKPAQTPIEKQQSVVRNSEEALAILNEVNSGLSKVEEARSIAKDFRQQIIAATREQQDLDRQGADLRLGYERQIADIRRGVEEKVTQLNQENKQKEIQLLAKQGEIREAQLRVELASMRAGFGSDELGQRLADAVGTYLQAQMSAENQLEQRRMQFQVELSNQQLEVERYKIDVSRTIARLNLDTAKQVEQINLNIARRNEDMIAADFQAQKEIGKRKLQIIMNELRLTMEKNNLQLRELAALEAGGGLSQVGKDFRAQLKTSDKDMRSAFATMRRNYDSLVASKPPKPLKPIAAPAMSNASFQALDEARRRGAALSKQFMQLEENLASIVSGGNIKQFAEELNNIAFSAFEAEFTKLNETLKSIDTNQGGTAAIVEGIDKSYTNLVAKVRALTGISEEQKKGMLDMLELSWKQQLAYEKLIPTVKKYNDLFDDQDQQIQQLKGSINELLGPVNELDKVMKYINDSGGIDVNPKLNNQLIANAKEIDRLTQKLKVLKGIKDIADGWTESFVDFNRELLKTGDLSKALEQWGERVSSKAIDLLLKFTLEPLQDQVFKQLATFFGFEAEKDPILQPVEQMALDVTVIRDKLIELAGKLNGAPVAAAATTTAVPGNVQQAFKLSDQEITAAVNTAIGEYGGKDSLGRTDVFANILARSRSGEYPKNLFDVVTQPGQYAPNFGRSRSQVTDPNLYGADLFSKVKAELLNPTLLSKSINDVNGRLYFKGVSEYPNMMQGDFLRASGQNFFHGPGREPGLNPQITKQLLGELYGTPANAIVPGPSAQAVSPSTAQTQQATNVQYPQTYTAAMSAGSTVAATPGPPDSFRPSDVFSDKLSDVENTLITDLYSISSGLDGFNSSIVDTSKMFTDMSGIGAKAFTNIADNIAKDDAMIRGAYENRLTVENENIEKIKGIGQKLGVGMQILGGIAMGIAGVQQMKKGGTYNTLMGLAGIFGAISQTSFGFGKLFGLKGFASGGRPPLDRPSWVGEKGIPELWWPDTAGTIIPIDQLEGSDDDSYDGPVFGSGRGSSQQSGRFAATRSAMKQERDSRAISSNQDSRSGGQGGVIEVRSESTVINNVEYVTKEQHERGMRETAKAARSMTLQDMRNSVSTRKRLGMG